MPSHSPDMIFPAFFGLFFTAFFGVFFMVWLLALVLGIASTVFWIVELVDACRREFPDQNTKLVWILVLIFSHGVGALVYYFVGKNQGRLPEPDGPPPQPNVSTETWSPGG